ncbi:uncharacterized protein [Haliotis cracherodii]|uniref:uncharacterized protein n=1 Tax=Haliotis cracherodii TaxID=6455 RepID=UPI0039EB41F7
MFTEHKNSIQSKYRLVSAFVHVHQCRGRNRALSDVCCSLLRRVDISAETKMKAFVPTQDTSDAKCSPLTSIPAATAEDMKEIAAYASWHAANHMKRYRSDAQRDEDTVRRHYSSLCNSGIFSHDFCFFYEQMAWAAAWSTANERMGKKRDAMLYKQKWLDYHMELAKSREVTSQLANDLRSLCWSSAWFTANTRKGFFYKKDAAEDARKMQVYYDRIRAN